MARSLIGGCGRWRSCGGGVCMMFPRGGQLRRRLIELIAISSITSLLSAGLLISPSSASAEAASLDQCANGQSSPLTLEACVNGTISATTYANWVHGDVNSSKAHWQEGDYIPYRATLTGMPGGGTSITLNGHYRTVSGGKHAIDYLGSFDSTETTSQTATAFHKNNSNPCFDVLGSGSGTGCWSPGGIANAPAGTFAIPATTVPNCNGSVGGPVTPPGGQLFKIYAPGAAGAAITNVT